MNSNSESDSSFEEDSEELDISEDEEGASAEPTGTDGDISAPKFASSGKNSSKSTGSKRAIWENSHLTREEKWEEQRRLYNPEYFQLFENDSKFPYQGENILPSVDLLESQIGVIVWRPKEKERFFNALSRKGRNDLPYIANAIGSKSELEVRDYLLLLRDREAELHYFGADSASISHADIPAALEVSKKCETKLEQAADILALVQDRHEQDVAERRNPRTWLIDLRVAITLDEKSRKLENEFVAKEGNSTHEGFEGDENSSNQRDIEDDNSSIPDVEGIPGNGLFWLSRWLELSQRLFMNFGKSRLPDNWQYITSLDEEPAITREAVELFHDIALSLTRRLVQTTIYVSQSRIRSSQRATGTRKIYRADVLAAVDVLGMTTSLADILIGLARRNSLEVYDDSRDNRESRNQILTYDQVERRLAKSFDRKSRRQEHYRRPISDKQRRLVTQETEFEESEIEIEIQPESQATNESQRSSPNPVSAASAENVAEEDSLPDSDMEVEENQPKDYNTLSFRAMTPTQRRRQTSLENKQDDYLERQDQLQSKIGEVQLWKVLGLNPSTNVANDTGVSVGSRVEVPPKSKDLLLDWQEPYAAEWEMFGAFIPDQNVVETSRQRKRSRTEARSDEDREAKRRRLRTKEVA